ncbi:hypothetical protein JCM10908_004470 [Rhodotorula pacifica]|uniref:uncharacterized protein n=1 Tax=Rhodotorula pacifica TaxID=1495444 RepID=UPI00317ADAF9
MSPRFASPLAFALFALALFSTSVSATYFTSPTASTTWATAAGQEITWKYQAGGAPQGDLILLAQGTAGTPLTTTPLVVATNVDLTSGSTTFPSGLQLRAATRKYYLLMVDSSDRTNVYSQVGPFEIDSFAAAAAGSGSGSASSGAASSSASSSVSSSAISSSASPSAAASSSSTASRPPVTATVVQTASSGVLVTMTLQPSSNGGSGASTVTVTQSTSASRAAASASGGATSGAVQKYGGAGLAVAIGTAAFGLAGLLAL